MKNNFLASFPTPDRDSIGSVSASAGSVKIGRAGRLAAALICALAVCVLLTPPSARAAACPVQGLTTHNGKAAIDVVGLSARGVSCAKAAGVARQVARSLATGNSLNLAGAAGVAIATMTPCAKCATQTHVSIGYPAGTIKMTLKGAAKLAGRAAAVIPFPNIPFPKIPGFPSFPRLPNIPGRVSPSSPNDGVTTV